MMWVTLALVAIVLGLILFSSINQDDIPDELSFLKGRPSGAQVAPVGVEETVVTQLNNGWTLRSSGQVIEATKQFSTTVNRGKYEFDRAVLGLMCDGKELHVRIDAQSHLTGRTESPVKFNGVETAWYKAQGTNLLAPNSQSVVKALRNGSVDVEMSYLDIGLATSRFDATGLKEVLAQFPAHCRF